MRASVDEVNDKVYSFLFVMMQVQVL